MLPSVTLSCHRSLSIKKPRCNSDFSVLQKVLVRDLGASGETPEHCSSGYRNREKISCVFPVLSLDSPSRSPRQPGRVGQPPGTRRAARLPAASCSPAPGRRRQTVPETPLCLSGGCGKGNGRAGDSAAGVAPGVSVGVNAAEGGTAEVEAGRVGLPPHPCPPAGCLAVQLLSGGCGDGWSRATAA